MQLFISYQWPGNLREFKNVIRRAALLTRNGESIKTSTLPWEITNTTGEPVRSEEPVLPAVSYTANSTSSNGPDLKNAASQAEYETIMTVLRQVRFNKTKAAEILKIDRKTLYNKLRVYEAQQQTEE
jgi:two-component system response regulator HydG